MSSDRIMERLQRLLPWLGPLLLLTGLVLYPVLQQLPSGRFGELLLLGLLCWSTGRGAGHIQRHAA